MPLKDILLVMINRVLHKIVSSVRNESKLRAQLTRSSLISSIFFLSSITALKAQTTKAVFDVYFNSKIIGTVTALKIQTNSKIVEDLHTKTDSKVLMLEVHVESEINITHNNNVLMKGIAYRHSNRGSEDIQSTVVRTDNRSYSIERNNKKQILKVNSIDFCVIDLYFTEPVGRANIFSNMYGQFIGITNQGQGKYKTVLPDGKKALYIYEAGKLTAIEVDMPIGKVISKRKN